MASLDDERRIRELLAPLASVEPAERSTSRRKRLVLVAITVAALVLVGVAVAAITGTPFAGISAAEHPQRASDVLDPSAQSVVRSLNSRATAPRLLPKTARLVGHLSDGRRFYVASTAAGELCVLVEAPRGTQGAALGCGDQLSATQPITAMVVRYGRKPPLSFGLAIDGVTAVSFKAGGKKVTVPVKNNVWAYEGPAYRLAALTAYYANGRTWTHRR